jgi:hypothetical protein
VISEVRKRIGTAWKTWLALTVNSVDQPIRDLTRLAG